MDLTPETESLLFRDISVGSFGITDLGEWVVEINTISPSEGGFVASGPQILTPVVSFREANWGAYAAATSLTLKLTWLGDTVPGLPFGLATLSGGMVANPEPTSMMLLATGLVGFAAYRRRRSKAA